jgi:hypothetical protein
MDRFRGIFIFCIFCILFCIFFVIFCILLAYFLSYSAYYFAYFLSYSIFCILFCIFIDIFCIYMSNMQNIDLSVFCILFFILYCIFCILLNIFYCIFRIFHCLFCILEGSRRLQLSALFSVQSESLHVTKDFKISTRNSQKLGILECRWLSHHRYDGCRYLPSNTSRSGVCYDS